MHKQLQANSRFLMGLYPREVIPLFQLPDSLGLLIMVVRYVHPAHTPPHIPHPHTCICQMHTTYTHTNIYHIHTLHITHIYSLIISSTYHTTHHTCHSLDILHAHTCCTHILHTSHATHTPHNSHPLPTWSIMRGLLSAHTTSSSLMGLHMTLYLESSPTFCPISPWDLYSF